MKWLVRVDGPEEGLKDLSQFLNNPDVRIFKQGDFYYLESNQLDNIETSQGASDKARVILAEIKGIAQLLLGWNIPIIFEAIVKPDKTGKAQVTLQKDLTYCVRPAIPLTIEDNQKKLELDPVKFFPRYVHLAMNDDLVLYVIQMVDFGFENWWALFCILDAIEGDIGKTEEGKRKKIEWMDQDERERFRATVQDRRLIGIHARHGQPDGPVPYDNPMTLLEAQKFIWNTVIKWLNEKEIPLQKKSYAIPSNATKSTPQESSNTGFCIRCRNSMVINSNKPLCPTCYQIWAKYSNRNYIEKYCHICGKESAQSINKPVCHSCSQKLKK